MRIAIVCISLALVFSGCTKSPYKSPAPPFYIWNFVITGFIITEVLSGNRYTLPDEYGDFDDYIEIYNPQDTAVDLAGFGLTDLLGVVKYTFPNPTVIAPDTCLLVWCDDEAEEGIFHSTFRISSGGEWLGLLDTGGAFVDSISVPALPTDSAFVRDTITRTWRIDAPSPGKF